MSLTISLLGIILIVVVLWDAFETIILPRRVTRRIRLTRALYKVGWTPWSAIAKRVSDKKRREKYLGLFGPLSLLMLLAVWAVALIIGYALLHWANVTTLNVPSETVSFKTYLYMSGVTFFTLGYGDVAPVGHL